MKAHYKVLVSIGLEMLVPELLKSRVCVVMFNSEVNLGRVRGAWVFLLPGPTRVLRTRWPSSWPQADCRVTESPVDTPSKNQARRILILF